MFSASLPLAERYAHLLATEGVVRGLIGPREVPRLWERHLVNCAVVGEGIGPDTDLCDIGTGAGLPGLVLAIARPDLAVTLVEPLLRRTTFLKEAVEALELDNVEVVRARAEELHGEREFSAVTSRAVAPLDRLLGWSMPLVRPAGVVLAMKGSSAADEVAAAEKTLRRYGAGEVAIESYGVGVIDPPTTVIRIGTRPGTSVSGRSRRSVAGGDRRRKARRKDR